MTFRYEEAYLTQYNNLKEARAAIKEYIRKYNFVRLHSSLQNITPAVAYCPAMLLVAARDAA